MTLILRKSRVHDLIMGWDASRPHEDDYVILDSATMVGRIYRDVIHGRPKWRWFLQVVPAPPPNQGMADTLNEAKAAFKRRYAEVKKSI